MMGQCHHVCEACAYTMPLSLQMFGADEASLGTGDHQQAAARRKQLVFELNRSGQYLQIKDQMKASVLRIVKEQYHKSGSMAREEMQAWQLSLLLSYCRDMCQLTATLWSGGCNMQTHLQQCSICVGTRGVCL